MSRNNKFNELFNKDKMSLVVSLPMNDFKLAKAAWENGADAIKIHLNVFHNATKTKFGTFKENELFINKLLAESPIPVGIVIGDDLIDIDNEILNIDKVQFDFISLYGNKIPISIYKNTNIPIVYAIGQDYTIEEIKAVDNLNLGSAIELSILNSSDYGNLLSSQVIAKYDQITKNSKLPFVLPTQCKIKIDDISMLKQIGINSLMIGAIVTGTSVESLTESVKLFSDEIRRVNSNEEK